MKRIFLSLFTIFTMVAVVAGGTQAVFSDTSSFVGNTISTATVNIDARSEAAGGTLGKPLSVSGLVPGQWGPTEWSRGVIFNEADSTNVRVYMHVNNLSAGCGNGSKFNLNVMTGHAASGAASERQFTVYNGPLNGINSVGERKEVTGHIFTGPNYLPANTSAVIQQQAQLDSTADNSYQNVTCTWDEVFTAETIDVI